MTGYSLLLAAFTRSLRTKLVLWTVSGLLPLGHGIGWYGSRLVQGSASLALLLLRGIRSRCLLR